MSASRAGKREGLDTKQRVLRRYNEHGAVVVDGRACPPLTAEFTTQRAEEARSNPNSNPSTLALALALALALTLTLTLA